MSQTVRVLSNGASALKSRIQRLPKLIGTIAESYAKRNAETLVKMFHDGIKENKLGLTKLKPATISAKEKMALERPESPLYGVGDYDLRHSYSNMMRIKKEKYKYTVYPSGEYEHAQRGKKKTGGRIRLRDLLIIHEYGRTISNAFGKGITVRLPPRPALRYSYTRLMAELRRKDPSKKVQKAMARYVGKALTDAELIQEGLRAIGKL